MQFHKQERQLISLCEIRVGHGMKDASRRVAAITESHTRAGSVSERSVKRSLRGEKAQAFSEEKRVW